MFGLNPGFFHVMSLILHIANSLLLFSVLKRMTGEFWKSAFVGALFALHPMNVESVAWVAELNNVLSGLFFMLTLLAYKFYTEHTTWKRYILALLLFELGLLAKPILMTLPFMLILLDLWPLKRIHVERKGDNGKALGLKTLDVSFTRLLLEKVPFLILSFVAFASIPLKATKLMPLYSPEIVPISLRISNAIVSTLKYLGKLFWPHDMAIFYPYPTMIPWWHVIGAGLVLMLISILAMRAIFKCPYCLVGWLWFLVGLVPVLGFVQGGSWPEMADRYAYLTYIGIFIALSWGIPDLLIRWKYYRSIIITAGSGVILILMVLTWNQVGFWKNEENLFRHATEVTENNYVAHDQLGIVLYYNRGDVEGAIREFQKAQLLNPNFSHVYFDLGRAYTKRREPLMAIEYYLEGLQINPYLPTSHNELGALLVLTGQTDEAIKQYAESLRLDPYQPVVYNNLGNTYIHKADLKKAADCFKAAILINPDYVEAHRSLDNVQIAQSKIEGSISMLKQELEAQPRNQALYEQLADLHRQLGELDEATFLYQKALSIKPDYTKALYGLALIYSTRQEYAKALDMLQGIRQFQPGNPEVYYKIACIYAKQKKVNESISWLKQAIDKGFNNWDQIKKDPDLASIRNTVFINELIKNH